MLPDVEDLSRLVIDRGLELDADYVEFRFHATYKESIKTKDGLLSSHNINYLYGVGIRVIINGAFGFSSTNILTESNLVRAVEEAISIARASSHLVEHKVHLGEEEVSSVEYFVAERKRWLDTPMEEKISFLKDLDSEISSLSKDVSSYRLFGLVYRKDEKYISSSIGTEVKSTIPITYLSYLLTVKKDSNVIQKKRSIGGAGGFEAINTHEIYQRTVENTKEIIDVVSNWRRSPKGTMDVIVGGEVSGIIAHECIGHSFEADRILGREGGQAGESYAKKLSVGEKIGTDEVYISDDPTLPSSGGYYLYDDEGVKARKKELIREGYVNEFLHNRETAYLFNTTSNGSARAACYDREPIVRMSNTFFEPGDYSFEELLEDIEYGVYIKGYMEWNIDDKRMNQRYTGLESYLIENGEIKFPIKYPVLEISTKTLLNSLDARGRVMEFYMGLCGKGEPYQLIPVWRGGPAIRLRGVVVGER